MCLPRFLSFLKFSAFLCNAFIILTSLMFELLVVFPAIHKFGIVFFINSTLAIFICFNILANLLVCEMVDTSIQSLTDRPAIDSIQHPSWHFCRECSTLVPPRAWHCSFCKVCILRRDHHCAFTGCCIGHRNSRYFIVFLFYAASGCLYSTLHCSIYIWGINYETYGNVQTVFKLICPFLLFWPFNWNSAFLFTYLTNIYFSLIATAFLIINLKCFLKGATIYEYRKKCFIYDLGSWKRNLEMILGDNMYMVWLSPFIKSKLPHNGIEWETTVQDIQLTTI